MSEQAGKSSEPHIAALRVQLVAKTEFFPPEDVAWSTDTDGGQALAEFAGRACYQSWKKPNPATATNAGYLRHILEVGHLSVLEHGSVSFYLTGISRSLTHELIRHRHFSYPPALRRRSSVRCAARRLRVSDRQDVVYAAAAAVVIPRSWKRVCMLMRRVS